MGFADKLRSTINKVTDTVQSVVDDAQSGFDPLPDETSKKYYEITYGLLSSIYFTQESSFNNSKEIKYEKFNFDDIKKFIEFHIGEPCNESILSNVLDNNFRHYDDKYFRYTSGHSGELSLKNFLLKQHIPQKKIEKLIEINRQLDLAQSYVCSKEKVCNICYKKYVDEIKSEYDNVLNVVEEYDNCKYLEDGLYRIEKKYNEIIPHTLVSYIIKSIVLDSFYSKNPVIRKCFISHFLRSSVVGRANTSNPLAYYSAITLRAFHFEDYSNAKSNYSSITDEECRDFILNFPGYIESLKLHPFDKDEYIDKYVKDIKDVLILRSFFHLSLDENSPEDNYFIDNMCNIAWKKIASMYDEPSEKYDIANMIYRYAKTDPYTEYEEYDEDDENEAFEYDRDFEGEILDL